MKNKCLLPIIAVMLTIAVPAQAQCPSDNASFCSQYELAQQGDAGAQFNLGVMYGNSEGVVTDKREAYIWHSIAKANGDENGYPPCRYRAGFLCVGG